MGCVPVLMGIVAALLFYRAEHTGLMWATAAITLASGWSYGVMHNVATEAAKRRSGYNGKFADFTNAEAEAVPNWISAINMVSAVLTLVAIILALYQTFV